MKRVFDFFLAFVLLAILALPILILAIVVRVTSGGPIFYWSDRVGTENKIFKMPKFRTMRTDTPQTATHLLPDPSKWRTPIGGFLRMTSMDELPQLVSILVGDMSFVGPRPALYNQSDLILLRTEKGIHQIRPGLTGWAQVNGRDDLSISAKVAYDAEYLQKQSLLFDLKVIVLTATQVFLGRGVSH